MSYSHKKSGYDRREAGNFGGCSSSYLPHVAYFLHIGLGLTHDFSGQRQLSPPFWRRDRASRSFWGQGRFLLHHLWMAVGATPNGLPILWVVDVLLFFFWKLPTYLDWFLLKAVPLYSCMRSPILPVTGQVDNKRSQLWMWLMAVVLTWERMADAPL